MRAMSGKTRSRMSRSSQQGFSAVALLICVITIMAVASGGWYVWQRNKDDSAKNSTSDILGNEGSAQNQEDQTKDTAVTEDWTTAVTQEKAFSIKVPDGWTITKYPGDYLGSFEVTYESGTPALINISDTEYFGHSLRFRASIVSLDDAGLGPQWSSPQPGLQESSKDFAIGQLKGKRYKGVFTQDINQTIYEYIFAVGSDKKLNIVYTVDHSKDETDEVDVVEKAINTIQLNNEIIQ